MSEILSPCGGPESLAAALNTGADAVYCGMKRFSARSSAENFTDEQLKTAAEECHKRGVKLYIALNTLVFDDELVDFAKAVVTAAECGADGMIVQDVGAAALASEICPEMPLHASTQMTLNSKSGVAAARELGFCRAVLGRELSEREIMKIAENSPIELEIFVHGALCVSVSGQCLMSAVFGGRSANRGECAQPCRLNFTDFYKTREYVLSLKDLSIIGAVKRLDGISSFKIEGRMKRPEYVARTTDACRRSLCGEPFDELSLRNIFSRGGLTDGYFSENLREMNGIRTKKDVEASSEALDRSLYKAEFPRYRLGISAKIRAGEPISAHASLGFAEFSVSIDKLPQPAKTSELAENAVRERLSKLGGTPFYAGEVTADVGKGLYVPAADLNALRRAVCDEAQRLVLEKNTPKYHINPPHAADFSRPREKREPRIRAEIHTEEQLREALSQDFELIYAPMELCETTLPTLPREKIAVAPPLWLASDEEIIREKLIKLRENGFIKGFAQTLAHARLLKDCGFEIHGGARMNVANSLTARVCADLEFKDLILSPEVSAARLQRLNSPVPCGIIAYGRLSLTLCRRCPAADGEPCGGKNTSCPKKLIDRKGREIPLLCEKRSVELLNPDVMILSDRRDFLEKFDFIVLKYTDERSVLPALEMYKNSAKPHGGCTRGIY